MVVKGQWRCFHFFFFVKPCIVFSGPMPFPFENMPSKHYSGRRRSRKIIFFLLQPSVAVSGNNTINSCSYQRLYFILREMRSEEEDRQAAKVHSSCTDSPMPIRGSRGEEKNRETDLQQAQKMFEDGLEKYKGEEFDAALKLFHESGRLFRKSPSGIIGNALCLSYSGMAFSKMKNREDFNAKAMALLFSESAVQAASGNEGPESDIRRNHHTMLQLLSVIADPLKSLEELRFEGCPSLMTLPNNIGNLSSLQYLSLQGCSSLVTLPNNIGNLSSLQILSLQGCSSLVTLPNNLGMLSSLQKLILTDCSSLMILPNSIGGLSSLKGLSLRGCSSFVALPNDLGDLSSLQILDLNYCSSLVSLPASLSRLRFLQELCLARCSSLVSLPDLQPLQQLRVLIMIDCSSLRWLPISHTKLSAFMYFSSSHTFCLLSGQLAAAAACDGCEKSVSLPCYSTPDLQQSLCLQCYRGIANGKKEIFSVLLCSDSPAYYPCEGREIINSGIRQMKMKEPALSFPASLMSKMEFKCAGCGEEGATGQVRWVCVGCAFFEGQSCAVCEGCVGRVERREQPLLMRLQTAQPGHQQTHSFVRTVVSEKDGEETVIEWFNWSG